MASDASAGWIEANGAALRYRLAGRGAKTLVLVHEMGGALESWELVLPALAERWRVLAYDTRGAGLSEKIRGGVAIGTMAEDLAALLEALGIGGPVALVGCAVGAAIAFHFALSFPARAAALVALAPAVGVAAERRADTLAYADGLERDGVRPGLDAALAGSYPAELRGDEQRFRLFRARRLANDPASYAAIYRMLAGLEMIGELGRLRCPVLVIAGSLDGVRPPALVEPVARAIPGARCRTMETGHFMAVQTPEPIAAAIAGFLGEAGF